MKGLLSYRNFCAKYMYANYVLPLAVRLIFQGAATINKSLIQKSIRQLRSVQKKK